MTPSLLILTVGLTDVVRSRGGGGWSTTRTRVTVAAAWAVLAVVAVAGLGVMPVAVAACIAMAALWVVCLPVVDGPRPRRLWPTVGLVLLVVVAMLWDGALPDASGILVDAYSRTQLEPLSGVSPATVVGAVAVVVFLTSSGNLIARAALGRSREDGTAPRDTGDRGWELRVRGTLVGTVDQPPRTETAARNLRGGRLIGPLERLLVLVLALAGFHTVITAVLAAKGIVRFPEISEDRRFGSKAEEFLIGSLASWSVAAAGVVYLKALHG